MGSSEYQVFLHFRRIILLKSTAIALIWKAYFDYQEFRLICEFQAFQRAPTMLMLQQSQENSINLLQHRTQLIKGGVWTLSKISLQKRKGHVEHKLHFSTWVVSRMQRLLSEHLVLEKVTLNLVKLLLFHSTWEYTNIRTVTQRSPISHTVCKLLMESHSTCSLSQDCL